MIDFYRKVALQYINQTPMGVDGGEPVLTPRLEGYEAALRLYGYAESDWVWLLEGAQLIHRLVYRMERINWYEELGKSLAEVQPEDVAELDDGDSGEHRPC